MTKRSPHYLLISLFGFSLLGACSTDDSAQPIDPGHPTTGSGGTVATGSGGTTATTGTGGSVDPGTGGTTTQPMGCAGTTGSGGAPNGAGGSMGTGGMGPGPYVKPAAAPSMGCNQGTSPGSGRRTIGYGQNQTRPYVVDGSSYTNGMPNKLVFTLHGCGGYVTSGTNLPKLPNFPNTLYVQWQGGDSGCYDDQTRASPDYEVFDALLTEIENTFCIDKNRVFADGFSSGAWMAMMLGCQRANVIKAHGQGAGGLPISIRPAVDCKGPVAALFSHGTTDDQNHIHGSRQDRDRLIRTNQCDSATKPYGGFAQCVEYQNCLPGYPVVYCEYPGLGHSPGANQDASISLFFNQF
jgi:polyhydroxybutyrate depolymerase